MSMLCSWSESLSASSYLPAWVFVAPALVHFALPAALGLGWTGQISRLCFSLSFSLFFCLLAS
jgi:hypothetical protein